MKQYRVIQEIYNLPIGTKVTWSQEDVGYEDLNPYWTYVYAYRDKQNQFHSGELDKRMVENYLDFFQLVEESF